MLNTSGAGSIAHTHATLAQVNKWWDIKAGEDANRISPEDRAFLKEHFLEAIVNQPVNMLRQMLLETLFRISRFEFPNEWPSLLPGIVACINSTDLGRVVGGLHALKMVFKRYQNFTEKLMDDLEAICQATFPTLLRLLSQGVAQNNPEAWSIVYPIMKIFCYATARHLPPFVMVDANLSAWMTQIFAIMGLQPATFVMPSSGYIKDHVLMKCKKWAIVVLCRTFERFGRPGITDKKKYGKFSDYYMNKFVVPTLRAFHGLLQQRNANKDSVTSRMINEIYSFYGASVEYSHTFKEMKPHLKFLVLESVFPTICLSPEDLDMFENDPQEYVRRQYDFMEECHDPRVAGSQFIIMLVKKRTRDSLTMITGAITEILNSSTCTAIHREGALNMFGTLKRLLLSEKKFFKSIEQIMLRHVIPGLQSEHAFMRARCCWVVNKYTKLKWSDPNDQKRAVEMVCNCLMNKELPVKMESAMAISKLLDNKKVFALLKSSLPVLLEQLFGMMDDLGSEMVVSTLSTVISLYGDDVAPFACSMSEKLVAMMLTLLQADAEDDQSAIVATEVMQALISILYACHEHPEVIARMEGSLAPLLDALLVPDGMEHMEDCLEVISCLTFYVSPISPWLWNVLPRIVKAFYEYAGDYVNNMASPLDNYIAKGGDAFFQSIAPGQPSYMQLVVDMCLTILQVGECVSCVSVTCLMLCQVKLWPYFLLASNKNSPPLGLRIRSERWMRSTPARSSTQFLPTTRARWTFWCPWSPR